MGILPFCPKRMIVYYKSYRPFILSYEFKEDKNGVDYFIYTNPINHYFAFTEEFFFNKNYKIIIQ